MIINNNKEAQWIKEEFKESQNLELMPDSIIDKVNVEFAAKKTIN